MLISPGPMTRILKTIIHHRVWIALAVVIAFVVFVRLRLREMPLERDEGEYAYAGQLMLQGIPPYKLAYNMKFPGIYAAYALVILIFGQSAQGVHMGLLAVNVASIFLMFRLGRKLLDANGGLVAATTFALLSLSTSVLGLAAHASHFVVLAALGGTLLLLRAAERKKKLVCFASGALFGIGFLLKQPGIFWAVFGLLYLCWVLIPNHYLVEERRVVTWRGSDRGKLRREAQSLRDDLKDPSGASGENKEQHQTLALCASYCAGVAMPFVLMCLALWAAGVFDRFVFWTFTFARQYVSVHPIFTIPAEYLRGALGIVFGPNLLLWILAILGAVLMWWDERLRSHRVLIAGFVGFSVMAVCPGWYFRQHYFVFLLPAAALLSAIALNRGLHLLRHDQTIELFLAIPIVGLFILGLALALVGNGSVWFELSPVAACRETFAEQLFPEDEEIANYIKTHAAANARIAVLGSEPEIYFYSRRHSATGYIYTYPLMEKHKYALQMQDEMIREIEAARPEYLIFVNVVESWLLRPESERRILDWYEQYSKTNYDLVRIAKPPADETIGPEARGVARTPGYLMLYQRKH